MYIPIILLIIVVFVVLVIIPDNRMEVIKDIQGDVEDSDNYYTKGELKDIDSGELLGGARPSDYKTTLAEPLDATASTTEEITVSSVTLVDGQTLTSDDVGDFICLKINPNASTRELVCCTGGITGTTFNDCSRGMSLKGDNAVYSGNEKSHSPGETVIISNDDAYLKEQFLSYGTAIDETIFYLGTTGDSASASTSAIMSKTYIDNSANQGAATSTESIAGISELATRIESASSTPWGANDPHVQQSEHATSTPSSVISSLGGGLWDIWSENDGKLNQLWFDLTEAFTWDGAHIFSDTLSVTGTSTFSGNTIGANGQFNMTASTTITGTTLPQPVYLATSTSAIQLSDANSEFDKDFMGFAISDATNGDSVLVQINGVVDGFSGLSAGLEYFVQDSVGTIGTATGTAQIFVGRAISATDIIIDTSRADEFLLSTAIDTSGSIAVPAYTTKIIVSMTISDEEVEYANIVLTKNGVLEGKVAACEIGTGTCNSNNTLTITWDPSATILTGAISGGSGSGIAYFYR